MIGKFCIKLSFIFWQSFNSILYCLFRNCFSLIECVQNGQWTKSLRRIDWKRQQQQKETRIERETKNTNRQMLNWNQQLIFFLAVFWPNYRKNKKAADAQKVLDLRPLCECAFNWSSVQNLIYILSVRRFSQSCRYILSWWNEMKKKHQQQQKHWQTCREFVMTFRFVLDIFDFFLFVVVWTQNVNRWILRAFFAAATAATHSFTQWHWEYLFLQHHIFRSFLLVVFVVVAIYCTLYTSILADV